MEKWEENGLLQLSDTQNMARFFRHQESTFFTPRREGTMLPLIRLYSFTTPFSMDPRHN